MKKSSVKNITIVLISLLFISCENEFDYGKIVNAVKTVQYNNVTQTTTEVSGNVITDNDARLFERGICYSTSTNPSVNGSKVVFDTATLGNYLCTLTNLAPSTTYYARAYATNSYGTAYGETVSFATLKATVPIISSTTSASQITATNASTGGTITNSGVSTIISRGVCYSSLVTVPTISGTKTTNGTGIGNFTSQLTGLNPNTTYYIRAYATNNIGTAYGDVKIFKTSNATIPFGITTTSVATITQNSASSGGSITNDGGAPITTKGICWSNSTSSPTIANSKTNDGTFISAFTSNMTSLLPNTTYYVRAYATNSIGTAYGNSITFKTLPNLTAGQSYQGGIIAYIFVSGDSGYVAGQTHGLIATSSNQSTSTQWGCSGILISGTNTLLGTGLANTTAIVNGCISSTSAAALCYNLSSGGYSDWYLPSKDELYKLYVNKILIGGFNNVNYWSSSQSGSTTAWNINFSSGASSSTSTKITNMYVRAIRKF